jgi:hypothetical protein
MPERSEHQGVAGEPELDRGGVHGVVGGAGHEADHA